MQITKGHRTIKEPPTKTNSESLPSPSLQPQMPWESSGRIARLCLRALPAASWHGLRGRPFNSLQPLGLFMLSCPALAWRGLNAVAGSCPAFDDRQFAPGAPASFPGAEEKLQRGIHRPSRFVRSRDHGR